MTQHVILYARFSSEAQNAASIDDQLRLCRQRVEREGWSVVATYTDEALSGASLLRPGYQALMDHLRQGGVDIALAESLDRFSRDQEHIAAFYKLAGFAGARIVTLAEGEISELHIGLKGTMGALYLKDLADRTRRGEAGRILQGRSTSKPAYGYKVAIRYRPDGERDKGLREIDPTEAAIVRRIFRDYAGGASPRAIARALNQEGVPGPSGGLWYDPSIRGRPTREDGILPNRLYTGTLVWNRRRNLKDPQTGRRVRRANPAEDLIEVEVPELRIIDQPLWEAVQQRLAAEAAPTVAPHQNRDATPQTMAFWARRRPKHLLTGKAFCGACGGPLVSKGKDYMACQAANHGTCSNRRALRRGPLESRVLACLRRDLMDPGAVAQFIEVLRATWQRKEREAGLEADAARRELAQAERKLANLVDAITEGLRHASLLRQLDELEAKCEQLRARINAAAPIRPLFPSNLAEVYRQRVTEFERALASRRTPEIIEATRGLIERVLVHPIPTRGGEPAIELEGSLVAMLRAGGAAVRAAPGQRRPDPVDLDLFESSVKEASGAEAPVPTPPPVPA